MSAILGGAILGDALVNANEGSEDDYDDYHDDDEEPRFGNNQAEDSEFKEAVRQIEKQIGRKLQDGERQRLHEAITGQGYPIAEIVAIGWRRIWKSEAERVGVVLWLVKGNGTRTTSA